MQLQPRSGREGECVVGSQFGRKYPGSGGARHHPPSGGADWCPLPEGMLTEVPIVERTVEVRRPGFFGRLLGLRDREVEVARVVGTRIEKHYD